MPGQSALPAVERREPGGGFAVWSGSDHNVREDLFWCCSQSVSSLLNRSRASPSPVYRNAWSIQRSRRDDEGPFLSTGDVLLVLTVNVFDCIDDLRGGVAVVVVGVAVLVLICCLRSRLRVLKTCCRQRRRVQRRTEYRPIRQRSAFTC